MSVPPVVAPSPILKRVWKIDDRLECLCLQYRKYCDAKILDITKYDDGLVYTVHYMGWGSTYDEQIHEDQAVDRFRELMDKTPEKVLAASSQVKKQMLSSRKSVGISKAKNSESIESSGVSNSKKLKQTTTVREVLRPRVRFSTSCRIQSEVPPRESITLTDALKDVLSKDRHFLMVDIMLPKIPARISVAEIIEQYRSWQKDGGSEGTQPSASNILLLKSKAKNECFRSLVSSVQVNDDLFASGLLDCFELLFSNAELLYLYEKPMCEDVACKEEYATGASDFGKFLCDQRPVSSQFGLVYLLRMLAKFHACLAVYTELSEEEFGELITRANNLVSFLDENWERFYSGKAEYSPSPPDYADRVKALRS